MATLKNEARSFGRAKGVKSSSVRSIEGDFNAAMKNLDKAAKDAGLKIPDSVFGTYDTIKDDPVKAMARSFDVISKEVKRNVALVREDKKKQYAQLNSAFMAKAGKDMRTMADLEARSNAAKHKIVANLTNAYKDISVPLTNKAQAIQKEMSGTFDRSLSNSLNFIADFVSEAESSVDSAVGDAKASVDASKKAAVKAAGVQAKKVEQSGIGFLAGAMKAAESLSSAFAKSVSESNKPGITGKIEAASEKAANKISAAVKNAMSFAIKEAKNAIDTGVTYAKIARAALTTRGSLSSLPSDGAIKFGIVKTGLKTGLAARKTARDVKYTSKKVVNGITRYFYD